MIRDEAEQKSLKRRVAVKLLAPMGARDPQPDYVNAVAMLAIAEERAHAAGLGAEFTTEETALTVNMGSLRTVNWPMAGSGTRGRTGCSTWRNPSVARNSARRISWG